MLNSHTGRRYTHYLDAWATIHNNPAHHAKTAYARTVESIKANARQAGKLQQQLVDYFGCPFEDLSEIVLVDPKTKSVCVLEPNLNDALVYKLRRPLRVTIAA